MVPSRLLVLAILILASLSPWTAYGQTVDGDRLWTLFHAATEDRSAIGPGLDEIRAMTPASATPRAVPLLDAFEGAFLAMSATTTAWPPSKLSRALDGLSLLDRAVEAAPEDATVRYLRLVIAHHVPALFRRGGTARADATVLADLLLDGRPAVRADQALEMAKFLLSTDYLPPVTASSIRERFPGS